MSINNNTVSHSNPRQVTSADSAVVLGVMEVLGVYWKNPINVGDAVVLQDDQGGEIWSGRCEVVNQSQLFTFPRPITVGGHKVSTIVSGTLNIYYR